MQELARNGYTNQEIKDALHGKRGNREIRFRYLLLDKDDNEIKELSTVENGEVSMGQFDTIKRTAKFKIKDDNSINYLTDRIQPIVELKVPEVKRKHDNYGLYFDGTDDYVNIENPNQLANANFTIEIDFTITSWKNSYQSLFSIRKGPGWNDLSMVILRNGGGKNLLLSISNGSQATTTNCATPILELNKKYRITGTFDGQMLRLYLDGLMVDEYLTNIVPSLTTNTLASIGHAGSTYYWNGNIFDVSLYNKALTSEQIQENKNKRLTGDESGLVGLWRLNEGIGTTTKDSTKNGNNGTINGATWQKNGIEIEKIPASWIEFPLGIFLLKSPTEKEENGKIWRDVEAYDGILVLKDDKFTSRYTITAGTNYKTAMIDILATAGITKHNINDTDKTVPVAIEFEIGTEKIEAINQLATAINYIQMVVDPYGYYTSYPYQSPGTRAIEYEYKDDHLSVIYNGMERELDTWDIPNQWVAVLSDPEREPMMATYENNNPESPTSTINLGRNIVRLLEPESVADQNALDGYVQRVAFESSQIYGRISFESAIMPMHDYADVLGITYEPLGLVNEKYSETGWTIPLVTGGKMRHDLRRVVNI